MNGDRPAGATMWPFFTYFGGKWRAAPHYPSPIFDRVIEPFAGSAGYSLRHHTKNVELSDVDPIVAGLWRYLIGVSADEIRSLPIKVDHVDNLPIAQEAKWLIGFWLNKGSTSPRLTPSKWMRGGTRPSSYWGATIRERIASQVDGIRHWKITEASFIEAAPDRHTTTFVDPPYQHVSGALYRHQFNDFAKLGEWCEAAPGQVIACEREGATWLPFQAFQQSKATPGSRGKGYSNEVIWTSSKDGVA